MTSIKVFFAAIAFVAMSFSHYAGLTHAERKHASNYLQLTQNDLLKNLNGLTPEQLNFKADSASWSIAECVEHIAISENNLSALTEMALKVPADPSKRSEVKMNDEAIITMITDRSVKRTAPESFKPSGKYGTYEAALKEFKTKRASNINYIKTTSDDLRNHYHDFPFGKLDAFQTILFMAGHSKRHTDQIGEIMRHLNFPKK